MIEVVLTEVMRYVRTPKVICQNVITSLYCHSERLSLHTLPKSVRGAYESALRIKEHR